MKINMRFFNLVFAEMEASKQLEEVFDWIKGQFEKRQPPRFTDVYDYAYRVRGFKTLKQSQLRKALRLFPGYAVNARQSRFPKFARKQRPILVNTVGCLQCDLGFFAVTREYETPVSFRSGFLVAKDILSRFTYVAILHKTKSAESLQKAFTEIFEKFKIQNKGKKVLSVAFDKEPAIMGRVMQNFFREKNVAFHAFENTASKSKLAELTIRLIRETIVRLKVNSKEQRWWHLLPLAVDALNMQPIKVNNKYIKQKDGNYFRPVDVNEFNVDYFIKQVQKAAPAYFFSNFSVDPSVIQFRFNVGDYVKPKLISTSSAVIGVKRSETTLENEIFVITKRMGYVSRSLTVEPLYICKSTVTDKTEAFEENIIALASHPPL